VPKINFEAEDYIDLRNWKIIKNEQSEPQLTKLVERI
jgi:hypothetical protein